MMTSFSEFKLVVQPVVDSAKNLWLPYLHIELSNWAFGRFLDTINFEIASFVRVATAFLDLSRTCDLRISEQLTQTDEPRKFF